MRRAQDIAERHGGQRHIVHIAPAAPDQPRILEAGYGLTYSELLHRTSPLKRLAFARLRGRMLEGADIKSRGTNNPAASRNDICATARRRFCWSAQSPSLRE